MPNRLINKTKKLNPVKADITAAYLEKEKKELLKTRKELERSRQELEQFVYMASHDLQEPLRMVANYTRLLAKRYSGRLDADADDFISYAVDGADRMWMFISNMLSYSRVRKREEEFIPTDCEYVFKSAIDNLHMAIMESGAVITRDILPVVMADYTQLVRVFQNLIGNAIKFCRDKKPEVHVGAERRDGEWIFSVSDNGVGVEDRYRAQIFNIFQRRHSKDHSRGTGIGLAICKKIVEHHGGRIWMDSKSEKGSVFYFSLPIGEAEDEYTNNQ